MSQVSILVNGRSYPIACDDGEEAHLHLLAAALDRRVADLARTVGPVGETRLFLMASLVLADDLADRTERLHRAEAALAAIRQGGRADDPITIEAESRAAQALERAAERVKALAQLYA
jgi:cell division protein ZapA